ncbi:hypothetical protein MXD81_50185 [Microbacteriaceae bacterium K1510]|nr:hypothetical protein [Microbacteriaceae bacterium K1510]
MMRIITLKRRKQRRRVRRLRQALRQFMHRALTKDDAMRRLGIHDDTELMIVLGGFGVPAPRLPKATIERLADEGLFWWRY